MVVADVQWWRVGIEMDSRSAGVINDYMGGPAVYFIKSQRSTTTAGIP